MSKASEERSLSSTAEKRVALDASDPSAVSTNGPRETGVDQSLDEGALALQDSDVALPEQWVLALDGASHWYGEIIALNDIDLHVPPGITGLLGPNGAGKSTLMRMAMGLVRPTTGTLRLLGEDPWDNPALMRRIGYVPEAPPPWPKRSGRECVALTAGLAGLSPKEADEAARKALAEVGLEDAMERPSGSYSQGMQQRLKIAIAIAHGPTFLVLDEPLTGTDPIARRYLMQLLQDLAGKGVSILVSTHVLEDVEALTDRIVLLNRGRLLAHGTVEEIRGLLDRYPRTVRVATTEPKRLGALLWPLDSVVDIAAEDQAVVVHTPNPALFHEQLQELLLREQGLEFTSVTTLDDNVEAVFRYLVESK